MSSMRTIDNPAMISKVTINSLSTAEQLPLIMPSRDRIQDTDNVSVK